MLRAIWLQVSLCLAVCTALCRAQNIDVAPLPFFGGHHNRWYIWLIVSLAGVTLIYVAFFAFRGYLVGRKRRMAFNREGISEEDPVYTQKHMAIMSKLLPQYKVPQGKVTTDFSPMSKTAQAWGELPTAQKPAV